MILDVPRCSLWSSATSISDGIIMVKICMLYASLYDGECEISRWWDFSCNYSRENRCRWAWDVAAHGGGLHRLHRSPSLIEWMEPCGVQPAAQEGRPDTPVPPAPTQRLHSLFFKFREASLLRHRGCIVSLSPHWWCRAEVQQSEISADATFHTGFHSKHTVDSIAGWWIPGAAWPRCNHQNRDGGLLLHHLKVGDGRA